MQGDACPCDHTDNVGDLSSCGIVSIQRERPRVVLLVGAQGDLLEDASRTGRVPDTRWSVGGVVGKPGKMVQLVCVLSGFFQTPMQKSPSCGGRAEFISSVPSLCQVTKELSMGAPSGGPISLPWAVNVHMPHADDRVVFGIVNP